MGRGEGSKRGIKGTLLSLHFKHQLAQHSSTEMQFVAVWLSIFCLPRFWPGLWLPLVFSGAGDSIDGILLVETRHAVLPGVSDTNLGWGAREKNHPLFCENWDLTYSGSAQFRQTQGVQYIPWVTLPGDLLFLS